MKEVTAGNINDQFFNSIHKDVWKKLVPAGLTEAEADFIEEVADLKEGDKVLDMMCGYGRHVIELAKRGYNTTAIDNLKEYIAEIKETAQQNNLPVKAEQQSALDMQLTDTYDAVLCMGNSFGFFNRDEANRILQNIAAHLEKGGVLIINTWMIAEIAIKFFKEKDWYYVDDYKYLIDSQYHLNPTRIEADHIIITKDGYIETMKGVDYIFTIAEMDAMLTSAGFNLKEIYSTPRKRKFKLGDTKAYIVAEKM